MALAYVHAALDDPTPERVAEAKRLTSEVLPEITRRKRGPVALSEARRLFELVAQLRTVMSFLERRAALC
jgi:hypothetical protein